MPLRIPALVAALLGFLFPARPHAAHLVAAPVVESLTATSAVVRWTTDVATGSRIQFGQHAGALTNRADGEIGARHRVLLPGLNPGTKYHFTAGTARQPLATNVLTTPKAAPGPDKPPSSAVSSNPAKVLAPRKAPPARDTWGHLASLQDHFDRHGRDFDAKDSEDYARQAWEFLQRARSEGLPAKVDDDGTIRIFDPKTRAFAAYNRNGATKTFFKPNSRDYFERQPGRLINAKTLKF